MKTFIISVTQQVEVNLDPAKFDEQFMAEFRDGFYPFHTLEDHAEHVAQLEARGLTDLEFERSKFIEGYGEADAAGISARVIHIEAEQS